MYFAWSLSITINYPPTQLANHLKADLFISSPLTCCVSNSHLLGNYSNRKMPADETV
ncbi:hypothetical protein HMPREF9372_3526 [Sporosarcina newyorkensis 2681]|uniref:Uncharacterized protein n=1 Tax=Sporosarcina newyorkensis 2681 TaxID=1027292 RepID=F9DXJ5_9BACL|nr:hypothetical protein HMPREF9372_3526 [Sporosarcina newyorkensis 2681]